MRRINVVGTSCSGRPPWLGPSPARLHLEHVELNALFWGPDWTPVPETVFRERVGAAVAGDA